MKPKSKRHVVSGTLTFRGHDCRAGPFKITRKVGTLSALVDACMSAPDAELVDELELRANDEQGRQRKIVFAFQSMTVPFDLQSQPRRRRASLP